MKQPAASNNTLMSQLCKSCFLVY